MPAPQEGSFERCILPESVCAAASYDTFAFAVAVWSTLQLIWTAILLTGQLWQVSRQMTTLEVSNLGRYGNITGRQIPPSQEHGLDATGAGPGPGAAVEDDDADLRHRRGGSGARGTTGFLLQILGLDRYTRGKAVDGMARASKASNPFDQGIFRNCLDFWTNGRELGVDYTEVYEVPPGGFRAALLQRRRERAAEGAGKPNSGKRTGLGRRKDGYQPVEMEAV